jgi:hypothetical protein
MSTKTLIATALVASLTALAGQAQAADNPDKAPEASQLQVSTVTRAEVLADLQIYRESGLALAELPENIGIDGDRKAKAQAKYAQLRNSPYYATLVKRYRDGESKVEVAAVR